MRESRPAPRASQAGRFLPSSRRMSAAARRRRNPISERLQFVVFWILQNVMERIMTRKAFGLAGIAALLLAAPAYAHHSFAMFDQSKVLHMTGTVKEFEFVNPHAWLHIAIVNDKGEVSTWSFEGGSALAIGEARLVEGHLQDRREGRGRLPPAEGRFSRRPAYERQDPKRAEAVLQPWLRRRKRRYCRPHLRNGRQEPHGSQLRPTVAAFSRNGRPAGSGWSCRSATALSCPCRRAPEARRRRPCKACPCGNRATFARGSHPYDRPRA